MGLALLIVVLKTLALRHKDERYHQAARFWANIFALNFLIGAVTGIPMASQATGRSAPLQTGVILGLSWLWKVHRRSFLCILHGNCVALVFSCTLATARGSFQSLTWRRLGTSSWLRQPKR